MTVPHVDGFGGPVDTDVGQGRYHAATVSCQQSRSATFRSGTLQSLHEGPKGKCRLLPEN